MTVPLDSAMCFTAGHIFAIAAGEAIGRDVETEEACLNRGRLFTALVVVTVGFVFLRKWPEWSCMYFVRRRSRSKLLGAVGLAGYVVAHELGFRNAARSIKAGRMVSAYAHTAASLGLVGLIGIALFRRLHWLGTVEEFENDIGRSIFTSPGFILTMAGSGAVVVPPALYVLARNAMARFNT